MSVLNQMLKDLDKRGAAQAGPQPRFEAAKKARWPWLLAVPAALAMAAGGWWYRGDIGTNQATLLPSAPLLLASAKAPQSPAPVETAASKPEITAREAAPQTDVQPLPAAPKAELKPAPAIEPKAAASAPVTEVKALPAVPKAGPLPAKAFAVKAAAPETAAPAKAATAKPAAARVQRELLSPAQQAQRLYQSALLAWQQQQLLEAEGDWKAALAADSQHQPSRLALASLYQQQGRLDDAIATLLPLSDSDAEVSLALTRVLVQKGDIKQAYQQLQMMPPTSRSGLQLKAELARLSGDLTAAAAQYRELANHYPNDGRLWVALGLTLEGLHQSSQAAAAYQKALDAASLSDEARQYARARWQALEQTP
ncbi:tetratricopeptide repeat protein [Gallaecimonas pentaromativorans]|uniref:tetratricopeptide repeat protein n=1 Tax=Gallaecimonas pentaromativorans TaxID=584787 RepID=UPI00067EB60C|nr:tetratricopeptide repeat protein [Gallaecimonas pentaromativorans]